MIVQYLKYAFRKIFSKNSFTLVNIIGLCVGVSSFFILSLYFAYENSYDRFFPNSENIYRLSLELKQNDRTIFNKATSSYSIGPLLKKELPEVKEYARAGYEKCLVYLKGEKQKRVDLFWVDSTFLNVVPVEMIVGDRNTALADPYSAVLSNEMAKFYFGNEDPLNKTIYVNEQLAFTVKGVFKSLPDNSHFNFKVLLSLSTGNVLWPGWGTNNINWEGDSWLYTYVQLKENTDKNAIKNKINTIVDKHLPERLKEDNFQYNFNLQAICDIHLNSQIENEFKVNGSKRDADIILIIGILIISIAWINYFNLINSSLYDNLKEISIRKVNGASKSNVIKQFVTEVFIVNSISVLISIVFIFLFIPKIESLSGKPIFSYLIENQWLYLLFPALLFMGIVISSIYPALIIASLTPQNSIKGYKLSNSGSLNFKKILIIFQLTASIVLTIGVISINKQLKFIQSKDLGYQKEQIIMIDAPCTLNMDSTKQDKYKSFKHELLTNSLINSVTSSGTGIGSQLFSDISYQFLDDRKIDNSFKTNSIDEHFIDVFNIQWLAGNNTSLKEYSNKQQVLINETASKLLGFPHPKDAIGGYLINNDSKNQIRGVIADFHQESLKCKLQPTVYFFNHPSNFGTYSVRINTTDISTTLNFIQKKWQLVYPDDPFIYNFLDNRLSELYYADQQFGTILLLFTVLSIFVACLGLLGLITITTRKNNKEIGVRKVNGAKTIEIMSMLLKDFTKWTFIAFVIACPIAYVFMQKWLQIFAYKTELSWWIFALSGFIAMGITLLTVSIQSFRAARRNPVESLRDE